MFSTEDSNSASAVDYLGMSLLEVIALDDFSYNLRIVNPRLVEYLTRESTVSEMFELLLIPPTLYDTLDADRAFALKTVVTLFESLPPLARLVIRKEKKFLRPFLSFLRHKKINSVHSGYYLSVFKTIFSTDPSAVFSRITRQKSFAKWVFGNISNTSIVEVLITVISWDTLGSGKITMHPDIDNWIIETEVDRRSLELLSPKHSLSVQNNACAVASGIVTHLESEFSFRGGRRYGDNANSDRSNARLARALLWRLLEKSEKFSGSTPTFYRGCVYRLLASVIRYINALGFTGDSDLVKRLAKGYSKLFKPLHSSSTVPRLACVDLLDCLSAILESPSKTLYTQVTKHKTFPALVSLFFGHFDNSIVSTRILRLFLEILENHDEKSKHLLNGTKLIDKMSTAMRDPSCLGFSLLLDLAAEIETHELKGKYSKKWKIVQKVVKEVSYSYQPYDMGNDQVDGTHLSSDYFLDDEYFDIEEQAIVDYENSGSSSSSDDLDDIQTGFDSDSF